MANILFLDDDSNRRNRFTRRMIGHIVTTVETANDCIDCFHGSLLQNKPFDLVCLDHDLGGEQYVDSLREDTGMEVVRWLCRVPLLTIPMVTRVPILVHSFNIPAATSMVHTLLSNGYQSKHSLFGTDEFYHVINTLLTKGSSLIHLDE